MGKDNFTNISIRIPFSYKCIITIVIPVVRLVSAMPVRPKSNWIPSRQPDSEIRNAEIPVIGRYSSLLNSLWHSDPTDNKLLLVSANFCTKRSLNHVQVPATVRPWKPGRWPCRRMKNVTTEHNTFENIAQFSYKNKTN